MVGRRVDRAPVEQHEPSSSTRARTRSRRPSPVDHAGLERPGQPHVLRDVRLPDLLRLLAGQGREADAGRAPARAGRSSSTGPREEMERDTEALQGYGLWATFQKDELSGTRVQAQGRAVSSRGSTRSSASVVAGLMEQTRELSSRPTSARGRPVTPSTTWSPRWRLPLVQRRPDRTPRRRPGSARPRPGAAAAAAPPRGRPVAAEFRRLTEQGLRERKTRQPDDGAIDALRARRGRQVVLDQAAGRGVGRRADRRAAAARRAAGPAHRRGRRGARTPRLDDARRRRPGRVCLAACYDFLTWLQETLTQALMA